MRSLPLVLLVLAIAACGGRAAAPGVADVSAGDAVKEAKTVVSEVLRTIRSADSDGLISLAHEALVVVGPRQRDAYPTRADAVLALRDQLDPKRKPKLSSNAILTAGPGGRSAYLFDRLALHRKPMSAIGLLDGHGGIWRLTALELAQPLSAAAARKALGKKTLSVPGAALASGGASGAKGSGPAVAALRRALAEPATLPAALERAGGTYVGSDGAAASGRQLARLGKRPWPWRYQLGDVHSVVTSDDALAYVSAVATRAPAAGEAATRAPAASEAADEAQAVRLGAILRKTAAGWELVILREAQAVAAGK